MSLHTGPAPRSRADLRVADEAQPGHNGKVRGESLSLVMPLHNEEDNVAPLVASVEAAMATFPLPWEVIFIDDGSTDHTLAKLTEACRGVRGRVSIIELQRNFGQSAAIQAGIDVARGTVIVTMDGDLQNDPRDIPAMVRRLIEEDLDLLSGWRVTRHDDLFLRKIPSRLANRLISFVTGIKLHDYGCALKVYRAEVLKGIRLYGEMHRFSPTWIATQTSPRRIKEQPVNHHPRLRGRSKYGISRVFRVLPDLLAMYFFMRFHASPGHFFGKIGLAFGAVGGLILAWLAFVKFFCQQPIGGRPLLFLGTLLTVVAIQFLTTGVLAEQVSRTYFATSAATSYVIRSVWREGHSIRRSLRTQVAEFRNQLT